jgi:hypothetical protein
LFNTNSLHTGRENLNTKNDLIFIEKLGAPVSRSEKNLISSMRLKFHGFALTLSLTGVGPFDHTPLKMQNTLNFLKARYCQKLGIPQDVSQACFEITTLLY